MWDAHRKTNSGGMILSRYHLSKKLHVLWARRTMAAFVLATLLCAGAAATNWAGALYILTGADDSAIILDGTGTAPDFSSQMVDVSTGSGGCDITLTAGQSVTVRSGEGTVSAVSRKETISSLLSRLRVIPGPLDMVGVDVSGETVVITVASDLTYYDEVKEAVSCETVRVANPDLPQGTEQVVQEGSDGYRTSIYEVVWSNGQEISRQFVEELDSTAVDRIVEYGTAVKAQTVSGSDPLVSVNKNADGSGTLVFQSGATLNFSNAKTMTATAYTSGHDGVGTRTASGTTVQVGTVAVDKSVIPLGTRMFIVTSDGIVYGMAVAEDTGVRGNKVDLYYDTYQQCINFGRRSCTVYILE